MNKEKRRVRGYKASDKIYDKARKVAKKEGTTLAQVVEKAVIAYGKGELRIGVDNNPNSDYQ